MLHKNKPINTPAPQRSLCFPLNFVEQYTVHMLANSSKQDSTCVFSISPMWLLALLRPLCCESCFMKAIIRHVLKILSKSHLCAHTQKDVLLGCGEQHPRAELICAGWEKKLFSFPENTSTQATHKVNQGLKPPSTWKAWLQNQSPLFPLLLWVM